MVDNSNVAKAVHQCINLTTSIRDCYAVEGIQVHANHAIECACPASYTCAILEQRSRSYKSQRSNINIQGFKACAWANT
jgi:hypothetical protein